MRGANSGTLHYGMLFNCTLSSPQLATTPGRCGHHSTCISASVCRSNVNSAASLPPIFRRSQIRKLPSAAPALHAVRAYAWLQATYRAVPDMLCGSLEGSIAPPAHCAQLAFATIGR